MIIKNVVFQQQRNFGEILNAAFSFISQEFKVFIKSLFYFCGPFILIGTFFISLNQYSVFSDDFFRGQDIVSNYKFLYFLGGYFFLFLGMIMIINTVFSYIKVYNLLGHNNFALEDVFNEVKANFLKVLLTNFILIFLFILLGIISAIFLFIPLIYLMTSSILIYPIQIFDNSNFSESMRRSFYLVKQRWWFTFGLIIITSLIINFISGVVSVPITSLAGIITYSLGVGEENQLISIIMVVYYSLAIISYYILTSVIFIVVAFQYFNLIEEKEHPTLYKRIKEINPETES